MRSPLRWRIKHRLHKANRHKANRHKANRHKAYRHKANKANKDSSIFRSPQKGKFRNTIVRKKIAVRGP
jgi:hypothetical protein